MFLQMPDLCVFYNIRSEWGLQTIIIDAYALVPNQQPYEILRWFCCASASK